MRACPEFFATLVRRLFAVATVFMVAMAVAGSPVSSAQAGFYEGQAAYRLGHYASAFRELQPAAERGHAVANAIIGHLYRDGLGVARDYGEAAKHYRRSAEGGYCPAMFSLARMYHLGRGVRDDPAEAAKWYRSAAEKGHAWAQFDLATFYEKGVLVPRDDVRAYFWFNALASNPRPTEDFADMTRRRVAARSLEVIHAHMTSQQFAEAVRLIDEWKADPNACETSGSAVLRIGPGASPP